jgi:RNase P subunit RPR2
MFTDFFRFLRKPEVTGFCMKCRETHAIKKGHQVILKNGRPAIKGTCGQCGTKMFRIESPKSVSA